MDGRSDAKLDHISELTSNSSIVKKLVKTATMKKQYTLLQYQEKNKYLENSELLLNISTSTNACLSKKRKGEEISESEDKQTKLEPESKDKRKKPKLDALSVGIFSEIIGDKQNSIETSKIKQKRLRQVHNIADVQIQSSKICEEKNGCQQPLYISSLFKNNPEIPQVGIYFLAEHGRKMAWSLDVNQFFRLDAGKTNKRTKDEQIKEPLFSKKKFEDLKIHSYLVSCLHSRFGIVNMTEVQEHTIPMLLKGKDALVKSCTGSGKTLAYCVPIVHSLQEIKPEIQRSSGVYALIIVPTRELALQTYECLSTLTKAFTRIVPGYLIGGEKKKSEKARIRKGINILVSTPGRLLDHLQHTANLSMKNINWLVIDEGDKLLEQGFEEAVLNIVSHIKQYSASHKRQTVMLSATLSKGVEHLAGISLTDPVYIDIATSSEKALTNEFVIPSQLKQHVIFTPTKLRLVTLSAFITDKCTAGSLKALIFMCTQIIVDFHYILFTEVLQKMLELKSCSTKFFKLHGNMNQNERTEIFKSFRSASSGILLCTDVAARGLDLLHVDWIIQYSAPSSPENYVHRVGRTARIGHQGESLLFLIPSEISFLKVLQENKINLKELVMENLLESLLFIIDVNQRNAKKVGHSKNIEEHATALQLKYENTVYADQSLQDCARNAFMSYTQAYASYPKSLRSVIPFKMLHLGHVAKSFCLRESPSTLGCRFSKPSYGYIKGKKFQERKLI